MSYIINDREDYVTRKELDYHYSIYKKFNSKCNEIKDEFYNNYNDSYGSKTVISYDIYNEGMYRISLTSASLFNPEDTLYFKKDELEKIGILNSIVDFIKHNKVISYAYCKSNVYFLFKHLKNDIDAYETARKFIKNNKDKVVNISEFDNEKYFKDTYKIINDIKELY